jgi:hypothetical protein
MTAQPRPDVPGPPLARSPRVQSAMVPSFGSLIVTNAAYVAPVPNFRLQLPPAPPLPPQTSGRDSAATKAEMTFSLLVNKGGVGS